MAKVTNGGSGAPLLTLATDQQFPLDLTIAGKHLFWANRDAATVMSLALPDAAAAGSSASLDWR